MKIIIKDKGGIKKVFVNGIDFDMMTEEFQIEQLLNLLNKKELKTAFLYALNEDDFDITKSQDNNGVVIELFKK